MSTKKKTIRKTEVEKENKKPPLLESPRKQEMQEITPEQERALYEGQEHIEDNPEEQSYQSNQVVTEMENAQKHPIITKPRETYLQEKMSKLDCNKNLMTNIKKELNDQIKTMVEEDNVLITEVPRDLNKYIKKQPDDIQNLKNISSDFSSKLKYRQLKVLKDEENILKNNLKQVEQNEKLLQDEGFINLNNSKKGYAKDSMFDKAIKEQQLKNVQQKKNKIKEKIKDIEIRILNIMQDDNQLSYKEKRKMFLDNFERDKEIAEIRAQKYLKESKERNQRMRKDINQLVEKRQKEIQEKEKEEQNQKERKIQQLKEKERAIEQKQSKLNKEIMEKYKQFRKNNLDKKGKDYRYSQLYEKYKKNEEKVYKVANEKRHILFESAKIEEINKFTKKVDEKKEKDELEREQKKLEMANNWKKNKDSLPKSNYIATTVEELMLKEEEEKKMKKEQVKARSLGKISYGDIIREKFAPEIDENLKKEREKHIAMNDPKSPPKKYTLNKQKKNRIILKKRDDTKPSKFKWELKLEDPSVDKFEELNKNLIKKPKKINLSPISRNKSLMPEKRPDYLRELITKKEEKNRSMSSSHKQKKEDNELNVIENSKKWEKEINNKNVNIIENINKIKEKANTLERKAEMKEKLLQLNGGVESNPELGKRVSSLLIDSIEAKLSILKKVNNS